MSTVMGNSNVSGSQEQEKNDAEEPNGSRDVQEEYTGLDSDEESGESDTGRQESDVKEESTRLANVPLVAADTDSGLEIYPSAARTDNPVQNEASIQEEAEEWMESPADTETSSQEAESTESECSPVKPTMEDGNKLELRSNARATESHVTEMNKQIIHGVSSTNSEVEKIQDHTLSKEYMEPQKGNDEVDIIQNSKGAEVEEIITIPNGVEETNGDQPMGLNPSGKDFEQTKAVSFTETREFHQVKASETDLEMKAEETKVIESGIKIQGNDIIGKTLQSSGSSVKESEKMDKYESPKTSIGHNEAAGSEDKESLSYGIKGEPRIDGSNVAENGRRVENVIQESNIEAAVVDANVNLEAEKAPMSEIAAKTDEDAEKVEMACLPKHADPVFLTMETPKQLQDFCAPSRVNELTVDLTDSRIGETEFKTSKDHKSSTTESYQQVHTTSIDGTTEPSFRAENPIACTEDPSAAPGKQDCSHDPFLRQIECTEANETVERHTSGSTLDDVKINADVTKASICKLLRSDSENGESDQAPLLNQEASTRKTDTCIRHPYTEKESEEKQVIALGRRSTETLEAPLLNHIKEETRVIESPKKREKNKLRFSLFGNCMCCTPVSQ